MLRSRDFKLRAKGRRAAFVRPLCRVERLTYDVPTPSSVIGIYEAVLWHPGLFWRPTKIEVLNPIKYFSLRTNEVKSFAAFGHTIDITDNDTGGPRTQRNTVGLYDVDYVFTAYFELDHTAEHTVSAFESMFERYLRRGQLHHTPYFGMLPFVCDVMETDEGYKTIERGIDRPLGPMFYRWNFDKKPPVPEMFDARLVDGVVHIPQKWT